MTSRAARRVYLWGYRYGEVPLAKLGETVEGLKFRQRKRPNELRVPVAVSLGPHVKCNARPHPDLQDPDTMRAGVMKRVGCKPPAIQAKHLDGLRTFVQQWCKRNLVPLPPDADVSYDTWEEGTNYPLWRKKELREWRTKIDTDGWKDKYAKVKAFVKDEHYGEYKHARGIYSRHDAYKVLVGPYFKAIENVLYSHPAFIKHIPVPDRPAYIRDYLEMQGCNYMATDYTAFESLFIPEIMEVVEYQMYDYMLSNVEGGKYILKMIKDVQLGVNVIDFKFLSLKLPGKRMSGEMCTSLGNGFSNLMFMLYMCSVVGTEDVVGCVEGDDGLFRGRGPFPTEKNFAEMGLNIKLEVHKEVNTASFCGMIFDTKDEIIVTDPMVQMAQFGWTTGKYAFAKDATLKRLLHSKALSLAYSYPGCPILSSLARYGVRVTAKFSKGALEKGDDWWTRERFKRMQEVNLAAVLEKRPTMDCRLLVEKRYGINVGDQLKIEAYLDSLNVITELDHPLILLHCPDVWGHYWASYQGEAEKDFFKASTLGSWPVMARFKKEWTCSSSS